MTLPFLIFKDLLIFYPWLNDSISYFNGILYFTVIVSQVQCKGFTDIIFKYFEPDEEFIFGLALFLYVSICVYIICGIINLLCGWLMSLDLSCVKLFFLLKYIISDNIYEHYILECICIYYYLFIIKWLMSHFLFWWIRLMSHFYWIIY
jgi:hypothetical protein